MSLLKPLRICILAPFVLAFAIGCSGKSAPDDIMTKSPTGLWIGKVDSGTSVDIESGGQFKLTRAGHEQNGTWKETTPGTLDVELEGQSVNLPYSRRDLGIKLTLPGDSAPTEFTQM